MKILSLTLALTLVSSPVFAVPRNASYNTEINYLTRLFQQSGDSIPRSRLKKLVDERDPDILHIIEQGYTACDYIERLGYDEAVRVFSEQEDHEGTRFVQLSKAYLCPQLH